MTPNHTNPVLPPPDGLDRLLSDFYRHEMPRPWPGPPAATAEPSAAVRRRADSGRRSRYTIAASVALLLGLGAYLSSVTPNGPATQGSGAGRLDPTKTSANGQDLIKNANPKPGVEHPMGVPNMP